VLVAVVLAVLTAEALEQAVQVVVVLVALTMLLVIKMEHRELQTLVRVVVHRERLVELEAQLLVLVVLALLF
jgi:hypothetical protein